MKTIGLIGGITYVSMLEYYRMLNELSNKILDDASRVKTFVYTYEVLKFRKVAINGNLIGIFVTS